MSATSITKYFSRPQILVDTTTVFDENGTISGPVFNLGVRQGLEYSIQVDWENNTGDIDVQFYGRSQPSQNFMLLQLNDCDGNLLDKINMITTIGTHILHFDRKFNEIEIRFIINSGQADVKSSVVIE